MLKVTVVSSGDVLMLECRGRIVRGDETAILCSAAGQNARSVVVDLTDVETIDAAGVGDLGAFVQGDPSRCADLPAETANNEKPHWFSPSR